MGKRRTFSDKFKREVVEAIVSGAATQAELAKKHTLSPVLISRWKREYKKGKYFEGKNSSDIARLELRIKELERLVGQLAFENKMLKKARDLESTKKKEDTSVITSGNLDQYKRGAK